MGEAIARLSHIVCPSFFIIANIGEMCALFPITVLLSFELTYPM
jgi:uncharacterized membrane protein YdjX (TVP38/TMEM64 family)